MQRMMLQLLLQTGMMTTSLQMVRMAGARAEAEATAGAELPGFTSARALGRRSQPSEPRLKPGDSMLARMLGKGWP